jgi:hypothetical protein
LSFSKKLPKVKNRPMCENSPNLVTLARLGTSRQCILAAAAALTSRRDLDSPKEFSPNYFLIRPLSLKSISEFAIPSQSRNLDKVGVVPT